MGYVYLAVAILAEVVATSALKSTAGFTRLMPSLLVVAGYVVSFYCLSLTLREISVGVSYAIWSGVGIVLVTGYAWIVHGEAMDLPALAGMGLIIAGVAVLNLLSKTAAH